MDKKEICLMLEMLEDYMWECEGDLLQSVLHTINVIKEKEGIG
jgi:hypothetical protein